MLVALSPDPLKEPMLLTARSVGRAPRLPPVATPQPPPPGP